MRSGAYAVETAATFEYFHYGILFVAITRSSVRIFGISLTVGTRNVRVVAC